jgi:GNAT superfamily N-acetyltransferase
MAKAAHAPLNLESEPKAADIQILEERIDDFNMQETGISDGKPFGLFLRGTGGAVIGGAEGWTWGGVCYIRHLFVPSTLRGQGHGGRLMEQIEAEARSRRCGQILVETHDFQAPGFYLKHGFAIIGTIEGYPRGHRRFTLVKPLDG